MILDRVVRPERSVVAVLPGTVRKIQCAYGGDDLIREDRIAGFVISIPDRYTRMIPVVAHPFPVLPDHLFGVPLAFVFREPVRTAGPNEEFVLDQQPGLIGD